MPRQRCLLVARRQQAVPGHRAWAKVIKQGLTDAHYLPLHFMLRLALNPTSKNAGTERSISNLNYFCSNHKWLIDTLACGPRTACCVWSLLGGSWIYSMLTLRQQCLGSDASSLRQPLRRLPSDSPSKARHGPRGAACLEALVKLKLDTDPNKIIEFITEFIQDKDGYHWCTTQRLFQPRFDNAAKGIIAYESKGFAAIGVVR
jgi:hypothetical protein